MSVQDEGGRSPYEKMLQECLRGELKLVNAGLPLGRKRLSDLLNEEHPHVVCNDGSTHLFKKSEIWYLAGMLDADEQGALSLPMIIEVGGNGTEAAIICEGTAEEKVISKVLAMSVTCEQRRIAIHRPRLALLRRRLRTTTVYVFSPGITT